MLPRLTALEHLTLVAIAGIGLLVAIAYGLSDPAFGGDSGVYLKVAQNIIHNGCVSLSDPASDSCVPHWGGNQFPGYPVLIAVAAWLSFAADSADQIAFVPATIILQTCLLAAAGYRLAVAILKLNGSLGLAALALLLVALSPLHFAWSRWILTETAATAAVVWIFAELLWSLQRGRLSIVPLGLALAVGFFLRYDTFPMCAAVAVAAFALHPPGQALRRGILVALILALPVAGWTVRNVAAGLPAIPQADYGVGHLRGDGYYTWLATWTRDFYEATHAAYPFANRDYDRVDVPERVLTDPGGVRARAALARLSTFAGQPLPAEFDDVFRKLADERRAAMPWQVYLVNPLYRAASMWLSPAYSFGWRLELGQEVQRQALSGSLSSVLSLVREHPGPAIGKAFLASYRLLLTLLFLGALLCALTFSKGARLPLVLVFVYCFAKTLFVVPLGQEDPRLATQSYALMEVTLVLQAPLVLAAWRRLRHRRSSGPGDRSMKSAE